MPTVEGGAPLEHHRKRTIPWQPVVVPDRPAASPTDRIRRHHRRPAHIRDLPEPKPFPFRHRQHRNDAAHETTPVHETRALKERARIAGHHDVVQLRSEQPADDRREDQIADRARIEAAPGGLVVHDDLCHDEAKEHREAESRQLERSNGVAEGMGDDR